MLLYVLSLYIGGGLSCGLTCGAMEYMNLSRNHKLCGDDLVVILAIFAISFLVWPIIFIMVIVENNRGKSIKKK